MELLPDEWRLDQLLKDDQSLVQNLLDILTRHIVDLQEFHTPLLTEQECAYWGSYTTLQSKLEENLTFLSLLQYEANSSLNATIECLSTGLREIFIKEHF